MEEQELALQEAAVKKWERVQARKKELEEKQRRENIAAKISTTSGFWDYVVKRGDRLVQLQSGDPSATFRKIKYQENALKAMALYFTNSPEFEKLDHKLFNQGSQPFSLNKGLMLFGPPGTGKTLMMEMFQFNPRMCYSIIQCSKLASLVSREGEAIMNTICKPYQNGSLFPPVSFLDGRKAITGLCFNDLGTEQRPVAYYGNKINVMEEIILNTYDNKVPFWHRYVTTNLTAPQLKETYGVRATDRMRQMYNVIDLIGESVR